MLNESKVKLMTRMAMYESKQGEEDFKISSYYKKDYRSFHTIATSICVTVGYAVAVGIGVIAFLDELMGNLNMDAYNDMSERIVGARSAEQYGITRGQNLLTPTSYGFSIKTYKIDVNGKYKIYRYRILPMLRIPNRQNPRP